MEVGQKANDYCCKCCACQIHIKKVPTAGIIVASAFIINAIFGGLSYVPGLYLSCFLETFDTGKTVTAWVISIQGSIMYFTGIIAGPLIARYGTRTVGVCGAILSVTGFLLSAFSPNVGFMYITFGIISGIGFGLLMVSNGVAVQQHTSEKRALAAGIAFVGSGLGAFLMPLVTKWAMMTYGWRGSLIFLSGILMHTLPCSLLLKPPSHCLPPVDNLDPDLGLTPEEKAVVRTTGDGSRKDLSRIAAVLNTESLMNSRLTISSSSMTIENSSREKGSNVGSTISLPVVFTSHLSINKINDTTRMRKGSVPESLPDIGSCWYRFKLFFSPSFNDDEPLLTPVTTLGIISWFFFFAGMPVIYVFMAVKGVSMGFALSEGATIMSFTGIGEVSGRIIGSCFGTCHEKLPILLYSLFVMIGGVCTSSVVLCSTYGEMVMTSVGYGVATGLSSSMSTTALRDLVGINRLPWLIGMAYTFGGIGNLLSIQTLAYAWEQTGSFFIPYLIGGALLVLSGMTMIGANFCRKSKYSSGECTLEIEEEIVS